MISLASSLQVGVFQVEERAQNKAQEQRRKNGANQNFGSADLFPTLPVGKQYFAQ
jgi:hypothetical protein